MRNLHTLRKLPIDSLPDIVGSKFLLPTLKEQCNGAKEKD